MPQRPQTMDQRRLDRPAAVALSSASAGSGSVVIAKGYGEVAELIVERARAHGLYVHASPDLVRLLMHIDLDHRIPPQLYAAVGEVLSWLHQLESDLVRIGAEVPAESARN